MDRYELTRPIKWGQQEITHFTIPTELKAKHVRGISVNMEKFDDVLQIIENMVEHPKSVIDNLDFKDVTALGEIVGNLLNAHQSRPIMKN